MKNPFTVVSQRFANKRHGREASLPWDELEKEAARQGCSVADILFDWPGKSLDPYTAPRDHPAP